jgi:t-SNARE complex subunit (syntaxin)
MTDKIDQIQTRLNETTKILQKNIEIVIDNTEKLENLEMKTIELSDDSKLFNKESKSLYRKFCKRNIKQKLIILALSLIPITCIIVFFVCLSGKC